MLHPCHAQTVVVRVFHAPGSRSRPRHLRKDTVLTVVIARGAAIRAQPFSWQHPGRSSMRVCAQTESKRLATVSDSVRCLWRSVNTDARAVSVHETDFTPEDFDSTRLAQSDSSPVQAVSPRRASKAPAPHDKHTLSSANAKREGKPAGKAFGGQAGRWFSRGRCDGPHLLRMLGRAWVDATERRFTGSD